VGRGPGRPAAQRPVRPPRPRQPDRRAGRHGARSDRRQPCTRLDVLLARFPKRDVRPERHSRNWDITIGEQRRRLLRLLRESPSLKHGLGELIAEAYQRARDQAALETGLPIGTVPEANPYSTAEIFAGRL